MVSPQALFGISIALSFLVWGIVAARYLWPALRMQARTDALRPLLQGRVGVGVEPGQLGATYFIPTVVVPLLLVTHVLVFRLLLRGART